jgi:hypothetical protein
MTSYLIDQLEALKENEKKLKEQQRVLQEEIEFEIEKKRRLELDGTIIKLRAQVGEISKNIEGEIMPDNRLLALHYGKQNNYERQQLRKREYDIESNPQLLTLEKFKDNLSKVSKELMEFVNTQRGNTKLKQQVKGCIPHQIKIYVDIIPIFTTMIGIMKKQEFEIDALKSKLDM